MTVEMEIVLQPEHAHKITMTVEMAFAFLLASALRVTMMAATVCV